MPRIDPTARVADGARIADDVEIGPFCIDRAATSSSATGVRLHVARHISPATPRSASAHAIYPFASLGTPPQSTAYRGEPTRLVIGADCQIREGVTINIGTGGRRRHHASATAAS